MRGLFTIALLVFASLAAFGQGPTITNISTMSLYPKGTIVITGSGFSNNAAVLQVWFGQVKGTIISASEFAIEVEVPPAANLANIEVINTSTRRSGTSLRKFSPRFYGEPFDAAKFSTFSSFTSPNEMRDLVTADLNNDGKPDIVATKFSASTDILILQNTSTGPGNINFSKISYPLNVPSDHIIAGDVDMDGFQDLIITKGGSTNRNMVYVLRNLSSAGGTVTFSAVPFQLPLTTNDVALRAALRDLNGDGRPEIIVTNLTNNALYIFQNDPTKPVGANPFITTPLKLNVAGMASTYGLDVQDFDGDGKPDILLNAVSTANHYVLKNTSTINTIQFAAPQQITLPGQLRNVTSADFNNDGKLDLVTSSTGTNIVSVLMNNSTTSGFSFSAPISLTADNAPWGISIADIEGDGDPDIIVANQLSATVNVFLHDGNFASPSFTKQTITTARPSRNVVAADIDSDGRPEISLASFVIGSYSVDVYRNTICHKPHILTEEPVFVCNNPVTLKTVPAINVTFDWQRDGTSVKNSADPFVSVSAGGVYVVRTSTVNPAGECSAVSSQSITVSGGVGSVPENVTLTASSTICSGATLNLSTPDVTAGATYKWVGPNWTQETTTPSASISNVSAANAGEYTLQIIVGNCKSNVSAGKLVNVAAADNFVITSNSSTNSACEPATITLSVNSVSGFEYAWKRNTDAYGAPSTVNTFVANQDGEYSVRVTNPVLGCPAREVGPVRVAILKIPTSDFSIGDPKCANVPLQFTNLSTIDADADGASAVAPVQWSWIFDDGKTSSEKNPKNTFAAPGTYNVKLNISYTGVAGCTSTKTIPVTIAASTLPVITASETALCPGQTATLAVSGSFSALSWEHGPTGTPITVTTPGTYTVNATDMGGCIVPKSIIIGVKDVPVITVTPESATIPAGQSVQLSASGANLFEWTPAESLNAANVPDPIATPTATTTYTVKGSYLDGCSAQAQVTVMVDASLIDIKPPLAFSPNGDSDNDLWVIPGVERYPDCTMNIFDGRGRRIYEKKGYANEWDGTYQGKPVPNGTYYYVFGCPNSKPLTGSVLIFR